MSDEPQSICISNLLPELTATVREYILKCFQHSEQVNGNGQTHASAKPSPDMVSGSTTPPAPPEPSTAVIVMEKAADLD